MSWDEYYKKVQGRPPRPLTVASMELLKTPGRAIDLGSGSGEDSIFMISKGWKVTAVEKEIKGIERLQGLLPPEAKPLLEVMHSSFEDLTSLPESDLILASLSLPFCSKEAFPTLWKNITKSLQKPGSVFSGDFFGPEDDWVKKGDDLNGHNEAEVKALLEGFEILRWKERNERGGTAAGPEKHWHVYTVIARRV